MTKNLTPDRPGRGAWGQRGGLLPLRPGYIGLLHYYRLAIESEGEEIVGKAGTLPGASWSQRVVHHGVRAIQEALDMPADGLYGPETDERVREVQRTVDSGYRSVDGAVGPRTALVLFAPLVRSIAIESGVPVEALGGVARHSSGLDPGFVSLAGDEVGIASINLILHDEVEAVQACNAEFALHWTAEKMKACAKEWKDETIVNPWTIAIAAQNSPELAEKWAEKGTPPFSMYRMQRGLPQIADFVQSVTRQGFAFLSTN